MSTQNSSEKKTVPKKKVGVALGATRSFPITTKPRGPVGARALFWEIIKKTRKR